MKPAPFRYYAPASLDEALGLLAEHGDDGKLLAGGQSLTPAMNFRLAQPAALIDLNGVAELFYLRATSTPLGAQASSPASVGAQASSPASLGAQASSPAPAGLAIGAMTRQRTLERSAEVASTAPLLHAAMPYIAHVQIRNRGTLGGSLAHADPAAELPAVMVALDAVFHLASTRGRRTVLAADFYQGLFTTALDSDEMLVQIDLPPQPPRSGWAVQEFTRRQGDYAIVGLAAHVQLDARGRCAAARLIYFSVGEGPTPATKAAAGLLGQTPDAATIRAAAAVAAQDDIEPLGDIHASAAYRRHLVEVLGRRALTEAFARAAGG